MFEKNLFGLEKNGDVKVWSIRIEDTYSDLPEAMIIITHGKEGGKLTVKTESVTQGKQGRTIYEQAVSQAEGRVKKQLDKNYRETKEELLDVPIIAMLAKDASMDKLDKLDIDFEKGVFVSDKLDGVRCLAKCVYDQDRQHSVITLESRTGQPYDVPHILNKLYSFMSPGDILDGELYIHGPLLQDINSAVKRTDPQEKINKAYLKLGKQLNKFGPESVEYLEAKAEHENSLLIAELRPQLEFRVFDLVKLNVPFRERLFDLQEYFNIKEFGNHVTCVGYSVANSKEELRKLHKDAVARGFEGVMFRTHDGVYESGKRSSGLWKYKEFMDAEFQVMDIVPDKQGHAVFILSNNLNTDIFNCVMGDMTQRDFYLANKHLFIGKWLKVKFQARYKGTLLPQFPVGLMFRECDEFGNAIE